MSEPIVTEEALKAALSTVMEPELHRDLISLDFIRDIRIHGPHVAFTIMLTTPACPLKETMRADCEQAIRRDLPQAGRIDIAFDSRVRSDRRIMEKLHLPIRNIVAVSSGKGGVGKSTVSVNLAVGLALDGAAVGLLDADVYGPNIPLLIGLQELPPPREEKLVPGRIHGVEVMSMGFLIPKGEALVWRGPMIHGAIQQMLTEVLWGELDYLIVDLPPGTGDAQLSVAQLVPLTGGIIVTTPQIVSVSDARRGITAFRRLEVPVLGIIENMTGEVFGRGGGELAARELGLDFLGSIPMDPGISRGGDRGLPVVVSDPDGEPARTFRRLGRVVAGKISVLDFQAASRSS